MKKVYVIAEAGVNHNGNMATAIAMIDEAAKAGADCVKFQTFVPENLVSRYAEKAEYQKKHTSSRESQLDMLKRLALTPKNFVALAEYSKRKNIDFSTTAFDEESIKMVQTLDIGFWKIPSGEVTNLPYLVQIAKYNEPIIMSTGMSNLDEIGQAVDIIRKYNNNKLVLLHCNTEYPTPMEDVNLLSMLCMKNVFKCAVGYSDHTLGIEVPIAAAALGASVIEKHFTLDKNMDGPDHKASLVPAELKQMVESIRNVEYALGTGEKVAQPSEMKNIWIARKSIVAKKYIPKGEPLTVENITTKRPGNGISPMRWNEVLGSPAIRNFEEDELIEV